MRAIASRVKAAFGSADSSVNNSALNRQPSVQSRVETVPEISNSNKDSKGNPAARSSQVVNGPISQPKAASKVSLVPGVMTFARARSRSQVHQFALN